jgi:hypothetical protein
MEGKEQHLLEISNWSAALESLEAEVDINSAKENIRGNITSNIQPIGSR